MLPKSDISILIFCLDDLSIVSGVLKSPTMILLLSISPFKYVNICFIYLGAPLLGAFTFMNVVSSYWIDSFIIV